MPPTEAVELLDETLGALILDRDIPVVAISGNHDSAERLSFGTTLLQRAGLHLVGKLTPVIITLSRSKGFRFIRCLSRIRRPFVTYIRTKRSRHMMTRCERFLRVVHLRDRVSSSDMPL
ncbi:hypothetical protein OVA29_13615 [Exiguobacterium sp. SL14]|nr:hypothetical protein [Exiguobacterium sp. SL14]MCY1691594.1 hypothetical protein [Exiguobacterium sp. SL14]